jgi:6-pyruvoyltetrahydropterin/6-carboxytetrahydropterin synthase
MGIANYDIKVRDHFSAAHLIKGYPGDCEKLHGHNWGVTAVWRCRALNELGLGVDFVEAKKALRSVLDRWEHRNLADHEDFAVENASSEVLARRIFQALSGPALPGTTVLRVEVEETPDCCAVYSESAS